METKWYKRNLGIIALLVLFFPAGLFLMWRSGWSKKIKIGITSLFFIFAISGAFIGEPIDKQNSNSKLSTSPTPAQTAVSSPIPSPTPAKSLEIVVTSQIVKKIEKNKYRYFFDIRNKDIEPFEGNVTIKLYKEDSKYSIWSDTFSTRAPIEPDLGTSVYIDFSTGPKSAQGNTAITKFDYQVKSGESIIKEGSGEISDKLEDLDALGF